MARKRQKQDLYVYMNGLHVGVLTRESTGSLVFTYDNDWLNNKNTRPISLSMPSTEIPYRGEVVENFFDNLLPDNDVIRERIQARFNAPSRRCFDLLAQIGGDCVGALQLLSQPKVSYVKKIQAHTITDRTIAKLLKNYKLAPLGMDPGFDFRVSIAGAQQKTALLWHQNQWHLPQGVTPTSHIIKLPIGEIKHSGIDLSESVENEWLCLKILSAYGLPVNEAHIEQFDDVKTLVVKRFDRKWTSNSKWLMRLPQEDFCQVLGLPSELKYESDGGPGIQDIMRILLGAKDPTGDRQIFMKSVFLFWVLGAIDGHAKNFSISIEPEGRYKLTPLYDVISAYPIVSNHQIQERQLKMSMSLKSKDRHYHWDRILPRHWHAMAEYCQFPEKQMQAIMDETCDTMDIVIDQVIAQLPKGFPQKMCDSIFLGMRRIRRRLQSKA